MGKRDRRHDNGLPFVQIHHWFRKTAAWRSLAPYSRLLYVELKGRYNGTNNGDIPMSHREAEDLLNCTNRPVLRAFEELEDRGFIVAERRGVFDGRVRFEGKGRATTWRLTELPQDYPERVLSPTHDFKAWLPTEPEKKRPHAKSTLHACEKHTGNGSTACEKHTARMPKAPDSGRNGRGHRMQKAHTSNLPGTSLPATAPLGQISSALLRSKIFARDKEGGRGRR